MALADFISEMAKKRKYISYWDSQRTFNLKSFAINKRE